MNPNSHSNWIKDWGLATGMILETIPDVSRLTAAQKLLRGTEL